MLEFLKILIISIVIQTAMSAVLFAKSEVIPLLNEIWHWWHNTVNTHFGKVVLPKDRTSFFEIKQKYHAMEASVSSHASKYEEEFNESLKDGWPLPTRDESGFEIWKLKHLQKIASIIKKIKTLQDFGYKNEFIETLIDENGYKPGLVIDQYGTIIQDPWSVEITNSPKTLMNTRLMEAILKLVALAGHNFRTFLTDPYIGLYERHMESIMQRVRENYELGARERNAWDTIKDIVTKLYSIGLYRMITLLENSVSTTMSAETLHSITKNPNLDNLIDLVAD